MLAFVCWQSSCNRYPQLCLPGDSWCGQCMSLATDARSRGQELHFDLMGHATAESAATEADHVIKLEREAGFPTCTQW
jgi:hypothetical protein